MKKLIAVILYVLLVVAFANAQKKAERQAIKDHCGCFEVDFRFKETFARQEDYELTDEYSAKARELVVLVEDEKNKVVLQHILVVQDTMIIKHWRQDWEYEPNRIFTFLGKDTWRSDALGSRTTDGQWSQEVFGTDETPRYAALATWFIADGRKYWSSQTDAPLPRREYSKRDDYQIMRRVNSIHIEDDKWIHEQDNEKVVLGNNTERVIVEEKGRNSYQRIDDEHCQRAMDWWNENHFFWTQVRTVWDEWLSTPRTYTVHKRNDDRFLPRELSAMSEEDFADTDAMRAAIRTTLAKYVKEVGKLSSSE